MYNFDQIIDRRNTSCVKYDNLVNVFGSTDILPMWVADMDFQVAPEILDAARECCEKGVFRVHGSEVIKPNKHSLTGWHVATVGK